MDVSPNQNLEQPRKVGRLLLTGVPGWLTGAILASIGQSPLEGLSSIRCLVQTDTAVGQFELSLQQLCDLDVVYGDLRDPESLRAAVRGMDTVVHTAAIRHVRRTLEWYAVNTEGTRALAEAAATSGVGRFVFISSNAAAGRSESLERPMRESDPPCPLSHYGRSKWLAEKAVSALQERMETVILRPCMFYGPGMPAHHVAMFRRVLHGRIPLVGGGQFARSLSHIDNVLQGCRLACAHPGAAGQTYYITDRQTYTTKQIFEAMAIALGVVPRFIRLPRLTGQMAHALDLALASTGLYWQTLHVAGESDWHVGASCEKACRELGYDPRIELGVGMTQAVEWCRSNGLIDSRP